MKHESDSQLVCHQSCPACGSSDGNALYDDGHTYCFVCGQFESNGATTTTKARKAVPSDLIKEVEVVGIHKRRITEPTCKHFGYGYGEYKGQRVHVAPYYDADHNLVAQKVRFPNKDFLFLGDSKKALPFGAQAFPKTGKMVVVTEGELDALAMSQVQDNKYPVVSIACGAGPQIKKYIAQHREYFLGFERVVLMFDMDPPGREAAKAAAEIIGSRARIAELPLKDACDMLKADRAKELIQCMWGAKEYRPEGIVDMADLKQEVMERPTNGLSWFLPTLTEWTYGIHRGRIYGWGAGTGVGKTDVFTQEAAHLATVHKEAIGMFYLEQTPRETATRLAGKLARKTFHIPDSGWTDADFEVAWSTLMDSGKIFLYDSFGNNTWSSVREKIEYLHHAHGVNYFFLDHLTALAAWEDDERKALEVIMSEMGALVTRLNITIFLISHLATPDGKPHEEGGRVMIRHFKGSRAIGFWCHYMFGLERDQQADNEVERATTTLRCLKDRYTGRATGKKMYLGYDQENGMLYETVAPDAAEHNGFKDETPAGVATESGDF
jgi:twinkle protein